MLENWPAKLADGVATVWSQPQEQTKTGEQGKGGEGNVRKLMAVLCSVLRHQRGHFEPFFISLCVFMPLDSPVRCTPNMSLQPIITRKFH